MNLNSITETIDKLLWGWPQIIILLGTHLFMSFRTGFIQKDIFKAIRLSVKSDPDAPGDVSQFGALTTALASTVGTANIIGVGTAIALGGPGAVLWIWFTGLFGIASGLFSNESGMGSAPLVAAAAQTRNPKRQALVSMTGTFWDTVVVCLMTGLVLVSCIIKHPFIDAASGNGSELTSQAFSTIPVVGNPILVVGLITFTFSTMLGWYYYGERCAVYLFGEKIILVYKIIWISGIFIGSIAELKTIWNIADILNGLMTIPNIIAVLLLSKMIAAETRKYSGKHIDDKDESEIPVINNSKKGVL